MKAEAVSYPEEDEVTIGKEQERTVCSYVVKDSVNDSSYWNHYYKKQICPAEPSLFAQYIATLVKPGRKMVELGCGNGRDAVFFANQGLYVTAIDLSSEAVNQLYNRNITNAKFICGDFVNADIHQPNSYDYAYSRFTIHSINCNQEQTLLDNLFRGLCSGGKLFIEVRGIHDSLFGRGKQVGRNAFIYHGHYRRFVVLEELVNSLERRGFLIEYAQECAGFAPYGNDNPPVIRIVAVKPKIE